jgi:hypothetical protein
MVDAVRARATKNADVANRNRKKLGSKRRLTGFIFFSWQAAPFTLQERDFS